MVDSIAGIEWLRPIRSGAIRPASRRAYRVVYARAHIVADCAPACCVRTALNSPGTAAVALLRALPRRRGLYGGIHLLRVPRTHDAGRCRAVPWMPREGHGVSERVMAEGNRQLPHSDEPERDARPGVREVNACVACFDRVGATSRTVDKTVIVSDTRTRAMPCARSSTLAPSLIAFACLWLIRLIASQTLVLKARLFLPHDLLRELSFCWHRLIDT